MHGCSTVTSVALHSGSGNHLHANHAGTWNMDRRDHLHCVKHQ